MIVNAFLQLFGIDSEDGQVHWQLHLSDLKPMRGWDYEEDNSGYFMFVQRTSEHFPYPPQMAIVGSSKVLFHIMLFA